MKKFAKFAVVLLSFVFIGAVAALTACNTVNEILIEEDNMPRLVFVQGQDLDLSDGILTVNRKNQTDEIPLNSSEVSVSGYNKDVLGEQNLTITYEGKSVQLTVSVIARLAAQKYETSYFVNDDFNASKGNLVIARDDGSTFTVPMNDSTVTVTGWNSANAGVVTLTANYKSGAMDFSGAFDVNIYDVDSVSFTAPRKVSYQSHETTIDLTGGFLTLKGNNGALTKYISLDEEMISGFNPDAVTLEDRGKDVEQSITVSYKGQNFPFKITVQLSNITIINRYAEELSSLDFSENLPLNISDTQGEHSLEVALLYANLDDRSKNLIAAEQVALIARTSSVYGFAKYSEAFAQNNALFTMTDAGRLLLVCQEYAGTKEAYADYAESYEVLGELADKLLVVSETFATETLPIEKDDETYVTIAEYLGFVYASEDFAYIDSMLGYVLGLYEQLESIPENYEVASLSTYKTQIDNALQYIKEGDFNSPNNRVLYNVVVGWRNDFFDLMYFYYFTSNEGDMDNQAIDVLKNVYLAGELETLYGLIRSAMTELSYMSNYILYDTTSFMLEYKQALALAEELAASSEDNGIYKKLYEELTFDNLLSSGGEPIAVGFDSLLGYLRTTQYGYLRNLGAMVNDSAFLSVWDNYLEIMGNTTNGYVESEQFGTDVEALLEEFVNLTPTQQYAFFTSLNSYYTYRYSQGYGHAFVLDLANVRNYFAQLIGMHYFSILEEEGFLTLQQLLVALESYSLRNMMDGAASGFVNLMDTVKQNYSKLSEADRDTLAFIYNKLAPLADRYASDFTGLDLAEGSEYREVFMNLASAAYECIYIYTAISYEQSSDFAVFLAAYENALVLVNEFLASASSDAKAAYYYDVTFYYETIGALSLDNYMFIASGYYANIMTSLKFNDGSVLLDKYVNSGLGTFFADAKYVINGYWGYTSSTSDEKVLNYFKETGAEQEELVLAIMEKFRALKKDERILIYNSLDGNMNYVNGLFYYLVAQLGDESSEFVSALLNAEMAYTFYENLPDAVLSSGKSYKQLFLEYMEKSITAYEALAEEAEDMEKYNTLTKTMYDFYMEKYNDLKASEPETPESEQN